MTLAIIFGEQRTFGEMGRAFSMLNFAWFGYFAYFYLLLFIYPAICLYKDYSLNKNRIKKIIGVLLLATSLLMIQFKFLNLGNIGALLIESLEPYIGIFGVWIIICASLIVGLIMLFPKTMAKIQNLIFIFAKKSYEFFKYHLINSKMYLSPKLKMFINFLQNKFNSFLNFISLPESKQLESKKEIKEVILDSTQVTTKENITQENMPKNENPKPQNIYTDAQIKDIKIETLESKHEKSYTIRLVDSNEVNEKDELKVDLDSIKDKIKRYNTPQIINNDKPNKYIKEVKDLDSNKAHLEIEQQNEPKNLDDILDETLDSLNTKTIKNLENINSLDSTIKEPTIESNLDSIKENFLAPKQAPKAETKAETNIQAKLESSTINNIQDDEFSLPDSTLLTTPKESKFHLEDGEIDQKIQNLLAKLKIFKIDGDVVRTYSGPMVTTFEFRPAPNIKVSRIVGLSNDLAMALLVKNKLRIRAPIPGKDVVGIEVPNSTQQIVYLKDIFESKEFKESTSPLTLGLGKDVVGNPFVADLAKLPHLLIAGTTGSGKSVGVNSMILSLLYRNSPDDLKLIMVDPKKVEFSLYEDIPYLLTPIITDAKKAIIALGNAVREMYRRYEMMKETQTKHINTYNEKAILNGREKLPFIVIIIDELAELMLTGGKEAEASIKSIAQMGRASGIHLIVATQRPSTDVITGLMKANLPARISFKVSTNIDSRVILDAEGAQNLLGNGDMLFSLGGGDNIQRLHAPWISEAEIEKIANFIRSQRVAQYDSSFLADSAVSNLGSDKVELDSDDSQNDILEEAKKMMLSDGKTSISNLQRRMNIGYNKAANIVEELERQGFLSAPNAKGVREILG